MYAGDDMLSLQPQPKNLLGKDGSFLKYGEDNPNLSCINYYRCIIINNTATLNHTIGRNTHSQTQQKPIPVLQFCIKFSTQFGGRYEAQLLNQYY